jgi:hypothetical protein
MDRRFADALGDRRRSRRHAVQDTYVEPQRQVAATEQRDELASLQLIETAFGPPQAGSDCRISS